MNLFDELYPKRLEGTTSPRGAEISACGKNRYKLWRLWDFSKPYCLFIMHNPSTADADQDDPTIRRCIAFAKSWGYGGIYVGNLIPYRATNPKDLIIAGWDACYCNWIENLDHIKVMADICSMHILANGNQILPDADFPVKWLDYPWHYLKLNKSNDPAHPLYLKSNLKPIK